MKRKIFGIPVMWLVLGAAAWVFRSQLGGLITSLKAKLTPAPKA